MVPVTATRPVNPLPPTITTKTSTHTKTPNMSERGHFRGARARASHRGGSGARGAPAPPDKKKENILDLAKYLEQGVRVKFSGGREGQSGVSSLRRD